LKQFTVEEVTTWPLLEPIRQEWNQLVHQLSLGPAQEFEWLGTAWEVNQSNRELLVLLLRDSEGLAGIAPFVQETEMRNGLRVKILRALGQLHTLHGTQMILARDSHAMLAAIFDHLEKNHGDWTLWFTQYQRGEEQESFYTRALEERGYAHEFHAAARSPYLQMQETWDDKLKSLQPRFRTALRSREKRIREKGRLELRFLDSPREWEAGLEAIREIEGDSWKIAAGSALTVQDFQWQFYSRYAPSAAEKGTLRIPILLLDGEPLAYDYALFDTDVYYLLKTSYKQKWQDLYPGFVLRKLLVEWAYAQKGKEIDFLGKEEDWKMKWTSTVREHNDFFVYNRTWSARYLRGLHRLKTILKRAG
jgi:CelD/BcsL family acetyltransferase involved in cellulose biosynthesis